MPDELEVLRAWWMRHTQRTDDERPFAKQPLAVILLRFYRSIAARIEELKSQVEKTPAEQRALVELEEVLEIVPAKTHWQRLIALWRGSLTTSDDPIWDEWLERCASGNIPDSWWGDLRPEG